MSAEELVLKIDLITSQDRELRISRDMVMGIDRYQVSAVPLEPGVGLVVVDSNLETAVDCLYRKFYG